MPTGPTCRSLLCALLLLAPGGTRAQGETFCQVVEVTIGAATIQRGRTRVTAVVGHVLATGDRIRTEAAARVRILCDSGLTVDVGPDTRIDLDALLVPPEEGGAVRLLRGVAGFLLPRPRSGGFEVRTPSAVAAVRSTEWAVEVSGEATTAFVREGRVAVGGRRSVVLLGPGEGVEVTAQGALGPVQSWDAERVDALGARIGPAWQARRSR
ncbi:FecR family protein [Jannaschia seohaensis]|uniref:FecR protein n=1 Tax=Jannaschia seohaensis TaxID=475081 RepID=A0A2Y9C5W1_9RHOB|nr:FecR family protein [Jannaschia seohaensis]PWJ21387.1 FecR protein [Jannaschia seohaensis]SSA41993.1 FecR protein [Jannaschia seohaensis]